MASGARRACGGGFLVRERGGIGSKGGSDYGFERGGLT